MNIYQITESSAAAVARFMSEIKPDWWDFAGAQAQLTDIGMLTKLVGWYMGEQKERPDGWILCAEFEPYSYLSIENLGSFENGKFAMEEPCGPLLKKAEAYARERGLRNLKYVISSSEMSCHGKPLTDFAAALSELETDARRHYRYFREYGFVPAGFLPNCYGTNHHGIIMIKDLTGEPG